MTWTFNRWHILLCNTHSEITLKPCCSRVKPCMTGSVHQVRLDIITWMLTLLPIKRKAKDPASTWSKEVEERPQTLFCFLSHLYFMSNNKKINNPVGYAEFVIWCSYHTNRLTSPFRFADVFICLIWWAFPPIFSCSSYRCSQINNNRCCPPTVGPALSSYERHCVQVQFWM